MHSRLDARFGETLADSATQMFFVNRLKSPACNQSLHGVEQFHPVFQRRLGNGLPLVVTLFALVKNPFAANALRVNLELLPFVGDAFPTDFGFGHGGLVLSPEF